MHLAPAMTVRAESAKPTDAAVTAATAVVTSVKPSLRGVSHEVSFFIALAATIALVLSERGDGAKALASLVFGGAMSLLFGTSALYHRVNWSPAARRMMRRFDHAAIFILIAGGYTPLFALVPGKNGGHAALFVIWAGCLVGVAKSISWAHAPKWVTALLCVGLGWMVTGQVVDRSAIVGHFAVAMLIGSGVVYSSGALVYALKRPDPWPKTFGYHEVFHALVIAGCGCLFAHVLAVLAAV
jgi:hemolysin III